jgi:uncharacterized protein (TIGR02466 family)
MKENKFFSFPVWNSKHFFKFNDELFNFVVREKESNKGRIISNYGGWQSLDVFGNIANYPFKNIYDKKLIEDFKFFLYNILVKDFFNVYKIRELQCLNGWFNLNFKNNFNVSHNHPQSVFSGVYYIRALENQGDFIIENPLTDFLTFNLADLTNIFVSTSESFRPSTGDFLLFPSCLRHRVSPNLTDSSRLSVSFNLGG